MQLGFDVTVALNCYSTSNVENTNDENLDQNG